MGALAKLINMLPNLLRLIILVFYSLLKHCKRVSSSHKYTSMINRKSLKFSYRKRANNQNMDEYYYCSICLSEFGEGDEARELVDCRHVFHCHCLEKWLRGYGPTCPLCRSLVVPRVVVEEYHQMQIEQESDGIEKELALIFFNLLHGVEAAMGSCTSRFYLFLAMFFIRCCID